MEDDHVARVVHNTLSGGVEVSNEMDIGVFRARGIKPRLTQDNDFLLLSLLILDQKYLARM